MPDIFGKSALLLSLLMGLGSANAASEPDTRPAQLATRLGVAYPAVIAHRGASFDAPESTVAAYVLARDLGADYLEMDLQRSKDGVLFALHDDNLSRTTDVAEKFPARKDSPASAFTLAELKTLDAGSWFNQAYPDRARASYVGLPLLTLDEIIDIAQANPDRSPGLYIETKSPQQFPGIEHDLKVTLSKRGWLTPIKTTDDHGAPRTGEGKGRVVLQTFDQNSLQLLQKEMPDTPKILLLWVGAGGMTPNSPVSFADSGEQDKAAYYAKLQPKDNAEFIQWLDYANAHGAIGTGPSAALVNGGEQSYFDLIQPWMNTANHDRGLLVHAYTLDEPVDFKKAMDAGVDGLFTNRPDALLNFFQRPATQSVTQLLKFNGY
ncbi:glycerophosphodiester phosphodiesterase [Pseudomonas sp.]|uniref:glycerophosphodiester phosphodiesterase n=1 Tax=Pseudomonas sp. TaxID=306 RepID=UPI00261FA46A|nr:glycerophosphodiester phosphodiesterase [Pseudomonas sp.]